VTVETVAASSGCYILARAERTMIMTSPGFSTLQEINTQTAAWSEAIELVLALAPHIGAIKMANRGQVLFTGCGSTYYLAMSAAQIFQARTGVVARACPASELLLNPAGVLSEHDGLLFAISRSGSTSETLRAVEDFKTKRQGKVVVITNYAKSPLTSLGDIVLAIESGQEQSVAQTKSFSSMHVAAAAIADMLGPSPVGAGCKDVLVGAGNRLIRDYSVLTQRLAADEQINQVFFLGSGPRHSLACEASLKLKEMSQTVSEPFHFLEFRHGPISMVDEKTLVVGLVSENAYRHEAAVLKEIAALGAQTLSVGEHDTDIEFRSGVAEHLRNVLYLPVLQLLAYHRAVVKGKNPDKPNNLTQFIELSFGT